MKTMTIEENLKKIKESLPKDVTLVAISKTKTIEQMMEAYNAGQRIFGENQVQQMEVKYPDMPKDVQWHMVGHLQRNKVKDIAPFVSLIHGVDSMRLLRRIDLDAKRNDRVIDCLLQIKIAREESKFGLDEKEAIEILNSDEIKKLKHVNIVGLMGMASFTEDKGQVSEEFASLKKLFDALKDDHQLTTLSMGMSGDYPIALEHGSNMVRVGSAIFGEREY
mgnify:CR=1 FL=1